MRHYTTIEQSKRLLELGLSRESADMYFIPGQGRNPTTGKPAEINFPMIGEAKGHPPCWSVGALEDIIWNCEFAAVPVLYNSNTETGYWMDINLENDRFETKSYSTIIDACFEMVCLLLENKYIKV